MKKYIIIGSIIVVICIATCLIIGQLNKSNDEPNKNNDINEKREN